jgi:hypothetical protein
MWKKTGSGAIDEDQFMSSFEDVPKVSIYSGRDVDEHLNRIRDIVGNTANDWDKRIDAVSVFILRREIRCDACWQLRLVWNSFIHLVPYLDETIPWFDLGRGA